MRSKSRRCSLLHGRIMSRWLHAPAGNSPGQVPSADPAGMRTKVFFESVKLVNQVADHFTLSRVADVVLPTDRKTRWLPE